MEPTESPIAEAAKDSSTVMPRNLPNLQARQAGCAHDNWQTPGQHCSARRQRFVAECRATPLCPRAQHAPQPVFSLNSQELQPGECDAAMPALQQDPARTPATCCPWNSAQPKLSPAMGQQGTPGCLLSFLQNFLQKPRSPAPLGVEPSSGVSDAAKQDGKESPNSRVTMVRSLGKVVQVFTRDPIAVLMAATCSRCNVGFATVPKRKRQAAIPTGCWSPPAAGE